MSVEIKLREVIVPLMTVTVSRVPCPYEWIDVGGVEWQAITVKHFTNTVSGDVQAEVSVLKGRETE